MPDHVEQSFVGTAADADHWPVTVLTADEAAAYRDDMLAALDGLRRDHAPDLTEAEFHARFVFHEAVIMKCVAMRFATSSRMHHLRERLVAAAEQAGIPLMDGAPNRVEDFLVHPIFYSRVTRPGNAQAADQAEAFLDSQPHYDRAFGAYAWSCWTALTDIDAETGGLCFFDPTADIDRLFHVPWGERNKYNYDLYVDHRAELDPVLARDCRHPDLNPGQAYLFDSNALHGATKPRGRTRVSFDFRILHKSVVADLGERGRTVIQRFNDDIDFSNAMNLSVMGDAAGAAAICPDMAARAQAQGLEAAPRYDLSRPLQKFAWGDEYAWV